MRYYEPYRIGIIRLVKERQRKRTRKDKMSNTTASFYDIKWLFDDIFLLFETQF